MTTTTKQVSALQVSVTPDVIGRLIKAARKTAKVDLYAGLTTSQATAAISEDAQALCNAAAAKINKATPAAAGATLISLLDNARALTFKSTAAKPAKVAAKAVKPAAKAKAETADVAKAAAKVVKAATKSAKIAKPAAKAVKPAAKVAKAVKPATKIAKTKPVDKSVKAGKAKALKAKVKANAKTIK